MNVVYVLICVKLCVYNLNNLFWTLHYKCVIYNIIHK